MSSPASSGSSRAQQSSRSSSSYLIQVLAVLLVVVGLAALALVVRPDVPPPERPEPTMPERVFVYESSPSSGAADVAGAATAELTSVTDELEVEALAASEEPVEFTFEDGEIMANPPGYESWPKAKKLLLAKKLLEKLEEKLSELIELLQANTLGADERAEVEHRALFELGQAGFGVEQLMEIGGPQAERRLRELDSNIDPSTWEFFQDYFGGQYGAPRPTQDPRVEPEPAPAPTTAPEDATSLEIAENLVANGAGDKAMPRLEELLRHELADEDRQRVYDLMREIRGEPPR